MTRHGWHPGLGGREASSLAYRTSTGQQAATEIWHRRGAP
jgi:hypothetical protein